MFRFFSSSRAEVFEERRKKQEVWRSMRRIIDRHAANALVISSDARKEPRLAISIPVLIQGFDEQNSRASEFAITKNISEEGMAIISTSSFENANVFCALWEDHPLCFVGTVRHSRPIGAGFWETGVDFIELVSLHDWEHLREQAMGLDPQV